MSGRNGLDFTAEPELAALFGTLTGLPVHERAYAARTLVKELTGAVTAAREVRQAAVRQMRDEGLTVAEIGNLIGLSNGGVDTVLTGRRRKLGPKVAGQEVEGG